MSVIFSACKKPNVFNRDMSHKRKLIRKAGYLSSDGIAKLTSGWEIEMDGKEFKISFSRDNLHVWVDGLAVETEAYISDAGYDVDLFFDLGNQKGHIFSDVDNGRNEMINYLLINDECVAQNFNQVSHIK